ALARRACPLATVEGEEARVERLEPEAAARAEESLGEETLRAVRLHHHRPAAVAEGALQRFVERPRASIDGGDDEVDVVLAVSIEEPHLGERDAQSVDAGLAEPELACPRQDLLVVALPAAHDRREEHEPLGPELAPHPLDDLMPALGADRLAAAGAVLDAELREEEAEVVGDLRDGGDGRRPASARQALLDRHRR